jgi:hypothetical protein
MTAGASRRAVDEGDASFQNEANKFNVKRRAEFQRANVARAGRRRLRLLAMLFVRPFVDAEMSRRRIAATAHSQPALWAEAAGTRIFVGQHGHSRQAVRVGSLGIVACGVF